MVGLGLRQGNGKRAWQDAYDTRLGTTGSFVCGPGEMCVEQAPSPTPGQGPQACPEGRRGVRNPESARAVLEKGRRGHVSRGWAGSATCTAQAASQGCIWQGQREVPCPAHEGGASSKERG